MLAKKKKKNKTNFSVAYKIAREDKEIRDSMEDWVDGRGNVINKYIYGEKWRYHLKLRDKLFNYLKNLIRRQQEELAKELGVKVEYDDLERQIIKKLLRALL